MPSELVNSVMSKPHPPRPRITRRNSVSVTPAMGASTAAGRIVKSRILYSAGNIAFLHLSGFRVSLRFVSPPLPSPAPPIKCSCGKGHPASKCAPTWDRAGRLCFVGRREREILQKFFQPQEFTSQRTRVRRPLGFAGLLLEGRANRG